MMDESSSSSVGDDATAPSADARIIEMTVTDWEFSPNAITAKQGETVIVRITGDEGDHSFMSKDLGINVTISPGETKDIVIPTDTAGTFAFRCAIPCGDGHRDMTGTIQIN